MVLITLSASFYRLRTLRILTIEMTSDVNADEVLSSLVNSSKGARAATIFSSSPHWLAVSVAGRSYSAVYTHRALFLCSEALDHVICTVPPHSYILLQTTGWHIFYFLSY